MKPRGSVKGRDLELEGKYRIRNEHLESIRQKLSDLKDSHRILIAGIREQEINDRYFDTREFTLAGHASSLRLRKTSIPGYVLCFKRNYQSSNTSDGLFSRIEIEGVPDNNLIRKIVQHAPWLAFHLSQNSDVESYKVPIEMFQSMGLHEVCHVRNNRTYYNVLHGSDLKVEICLDRIECSSLQSVERFYEMEIERLSGDDKEFASFCHMIEDEMPWLKPSQYNKYIQSLVALKLWEPGSFYGAGKKSQWAKQFNKIFKRFRKYYKKAIKFRTEEDVHQARVALRQLVTLLEFLLRRNYKRKLSAHALLNKFTKARKILGKVRDYDVLLLALSDKDTPVTEGIYHFESDLRHLLLLQRDRARLNAIVKLPRFINKDIRKHWNRFINTELSTLLEQADLQADYIDLKRRFNLSVKQFFKSRELRGPIHPITEKNLHHTRILSKNLRYAADYLSFVLPGEQNPDIEHYRGIQNELGEINDLYNQLAMYIRLKEKMSNLIDERLDHTIATIQGEIESRIVNLEIEKFYDQPGLKLGEDESFDPNTEVIAIRGIGPKTAEELHHHGIDTISEIAALTKEKLDILASRGYDVRERIQREEWITQARELMSFTPRNA